MNDENKSRLTESKSAIIRLLGKFTVWLYWLMSTGLLGHIFGGYTKENKAFNESFAARTFGGNSKLGIGLRKVRFAIAEQFEESRILRLWRTFMRFLAGCRLRLYGAFFMTFGVYTGLVYFFKSYVISSETADKSYIICLVILTLASVPLILSNKTFTQAVMLSRSGHFVAGDILGIPDEKLDLNQTRHGESYNIAIFAGIAAGTLSYLVNPFRILAVLGIFFAFAVVITYPEIGALSVLFLLPLLSKGSESFGALEVLIITYIVSYFIKLIRGKRTINFEIYDLALLFFAVLLAFGGNASVGPMSVSEANRLIVLLLGCFVAGNLMRTKRWQQRCLVTSTLSGCGVALTLIWQRVAEVSGGLFGVSPAIGERGWLPVFNDNNLLAAYLIISLLLACASAYSSKNIKQRIVACFAGIAILVALMLTMSASGWTGAAVAIIIFFLIMSHKTVIVSVFTALIGTTALIVTKGFLSQRLISAFDTTSDTTYPMIKIWQGTIRMLRSSFFGGVGVDGFSELYPFFAATGFESATDSGALWLRILCDVGIVGLAIFGLVIYFYLQNCFEYIRSPLDKESKSCVAAGAAICIGLLVQSLFCDIWSSKLLFFAFFAVMAIVCAGIRSDRRELINSREISGNNEYSATTVL